MRRLRPLGAVVLVMACALGTVTGVSSAEESSTLPELPAPPDACAVAPTKVVARLSGARVTRSLGSRHPHDLGMDSRSMMSVSECEYCATRCAAVPYVRLRVGNLRDEPTAAAEFATEVAIARSGGGPAVHVDGPWRDAYVLGGLEMYALIGSTIVYAGLRESHPASVRYRTGAARALVTRVSQTLGGVPGDRVMPAHLGPRPVCGLVRARAVAHLLGLERLYSREGMIQGTGGVVADEMVMGSCLFSPGPTWGMRLPAGRLTLEAVPTKAEAKREYGAQLRMTEERNGDVLRAIHGLGVPATAVSDLQTYALVDRFIVQFELVETGPRKTQHYPPRAARAVIALAVRALQRGELQ